MKKSILSLALIFSLVLISLNVFAADGDLIVNGKVGIGTTTPAQKLSVAGTIESTTGGIKFPDGTIQTTASKVVQIVNYTNGAYASNTSSLIPKDNTIPQNTEGAQWSTLSITPKSVQNKLLIEVILQGTLTASYKNFVAALFKDSDVNALAAGYLDCYSYGTGCLVLRRYMDAGTTNAITFKVRYSGVINGKTFGGVSSSSITITEFAP